MMLVVDASATLAWVLDDERTTTIETVFHAVARHGALVPMHWHLEVGNATILAVRRGRLALTARSTALAGLAALGIETDQQTSAHAWSATLALADLYGLTLYDAAYLELAQRRRLPLVTLDGALAQAAEKAGVEVRP